VINIKLLKLWRKIGVQPLHFSRKTNAIVKVDDKQYIITGIKYKNDKWLYMNAEDFIQCKYCEHFLKQHPHTCDICTSLDQEEDYEMFSSKK